jgi:DNA (cytosine-5)-methyltransferase 1
LNYLDLFHGIGGFALGAYWAGMKFENHYCSDIEPWCQKLYAQRFPDSIQLGDITKINAQDLPAGEWIISGGFPCQDISIAGKGAGIHGERSGLWFEYWRLIRDLRPRFAIMENVSALTFSGLGIVLGTLHEIGYNAEWQNIPASAIGACHRRERIWIVAYPDEMGRKICHKSITQRSLSWDRMETNPRIREKPDTRILRNYDGIPGPMDKYRIAGLGNAIVPQIAELLFRQIKNLL